MKGANIIFIISVLMLVISIPLILVGITTSNIELLGMGIIFLITGIIISQIIYKEFVSINRKMIYRNNKLTEEEIELIEDAKKLIKSVDENIVISDFNVYKIKSLFRCWNYYDEDNKESNIFIPFKQFIKFGKDFCFQAVVHEMLHAQNLKNNLMIFNNKFCEGLTQILTIWLIENYAEKYKYPKFICLARIKIKKDTTLDIMNEHKIYVQEMEMVQEVLDKANVDLKEVYLNYIYINTQFFQSFVPEKYFKKSKK